MQIEKLIVTFKKEFPHWGAPKIHDLGYFDSDNCRLEPIDNPFAAKVLPMCPEWT
jgi:hypothetical protein